MPINVTCKRLSGVKWERIVFSIPPVDGYHGMVDVGYAKHCRGEYCHNEFDNDQSYINCIEPSWAYVNLRLSKIKGMRKEIFYMYFKEKEFLFDNHGENLYLLLLKLLGEKPI